MKAFSTEIDIHAPAETVWSILTNGAKYQEWDANMISLDGKIAPGETLTITTKFDPNRAFKPKVEVFEPNRKMVWKSGMPLGLFSGERTFTLTPQGAESVKFSMREEFKGLLLPLFGGSIPDMTPVFDEFGKALKHRAENAS